MKMFAAAGAVRRISRGRKTFKYLVGDGIDEDVLPATD